jgi:alpha-2-macroglobulin
VAMRAANANLTAGNGRKISVPANDRVEVRFPVAAERAGTARFQIGATSEKFADAAEFELPVYTPATGETFAVYGTTDESGAIAQPIEMPENVFPQFGGLEVTTSSTQLQELTDAFIYLQNYPFECAEQTASRVLSVAALRDVLQTFEAKDLPSPEQIEAKMKSDIERLSKLQQDDGGFAFWRRDGTAYPFVSVHVAHALARAQQKGYAVPPEMIAKSRAYLKNVEAKYPNFYSRESQQAISAYALYVRDLLGDNDAGKGRKFLSESGLENLSPETLGWILSVLAADKNSLAEVEAIKRHLLNRVTETAGAAHFVSNYKDGEYVLLSSDRRADGVILEALLKTKSAPRAAASGTNVDDLIPKIVRGLLASRAKGRWANTQENVFVLLALDEYFQTYERATPNFVARVWLGDAFAGEQKFVGRSTDSNLLRVPMNYLEKQKGAANLILDKQGDGRIYYRIGLNYAAKNLRLAAADYGFTVTRSYEAIDNPGDVRRDADGNWTIKSGARVRVKIQMVAPTRRYHVALVDKLPAGLEIINAALAVSETVPNEPPQFRDFRYNWHEHQNLRDERAEVFAARLWEGVWLYSYNARATTPGKFFAPPAKAEEMYAPETFGRSATDSVIIE